MECSGADLTNWNHNPVNFFKSSPYLKIVQWKKHTRTTKLYQQRASLTGFLKTCLPSEGQQKRWIAIFAESKLVTRNWWKIHNNVENECFFLHNTWITFLENEYFFKNLKTINMFCDSSFQLLRCATSWSKWAGKTNDVNGVISVKMSSDWLTSLNLWREQNVAQDKLKTRN